MVITTQLGGGVRDPVADPVQPPSHPHPWTRIGALHPRSPQHTHTQGVPSSRSPLPHPAQGHSDVTHPVFPHRDQDNHSAGPSPGVWFPGRKCDTAMQTAPPGTQCDGDASDLDQAETGRARPQRGSLPPHPGPQLPRVQPVGIYGRQARREAAGRLTGCAGVARGR